MAGCKNIFPNCSYKYFGLKLKYLSVSGLGLGLPPSPYSGLYGADPLHAELLAREAQRAAEMRLVETQRLESLRQAEARASSFLSSFSKGKVILVSIVSIITAFL